ncbi:hypothetical protein KKB11_01355 [Candidatus Micrarchaeota archaeon]|nr:hypothetical protein [Candidatus Micrarchaeota archaeon]
MKDWFILEEIPRTHYHLFEGASDYWSKEMKKDIGVKLDTFICFKKGENFFGFTKKRHAEAGKRTLKKILKNPQWYLNIQKQLEFYSNKLMNSSNALQKKDFSLMSDKELEKTFSSHLFFHNKCHKLGMLDFVLEWGYELLSNYLKSHLKEKIKEKNLPFKVSATFSLLTTPHKESFQLKQEKEAMNIALKILKDKKTKNLFLNKNPEQIIDLLPSVNKKIGKEIHFHYRKWNWLPFMYIGPPWDKEYFVDEIKELIRNEKELPELFKKMNSRIKEIKTEQKQLIRQLCLDKKHKSLFDISRNIVYLKGLRKDALYHSFYSYEPLLKEIGKRLGLSLNQLRFMWPSEYKKAILKRQYNPKELNDRFNFSIIVIINEKRKILTGKAAEKFRKQLPSPKEYKLSELEGSTAVPGMVKGTAKIINLPEDMAKMNEGDVMVSYSTNPNLVPAMKKASAIITDVGGVTCHAAIVSRELNIPCIIGTKIATKAIKDGDLLDVNANHGIIKILKKGKK